MVVAPTHHHLGPAARATAGPNPATTLRKRPPPDDMNGRLGTKRGKTIPGVDVLNATWLTNPPQAVLDAPRTTGTTEAVAATTAAADCPGDIAPAAPPPQQPQQPEKDHDAESAPTQQQQQQQQEQQHDEQQQQQQQHPQTFIKSIEFHQNLLKCKQIR